MGKLSGLKSQYEKASTDVQEIAGKLKEAQEGLNTLRSTLNHINAQPPVFKANLKRINPQLWEQETEFPGEISSLHAKLQKASDDAGKIKQAYEE